VGRNVCGEIIFTTSSTNKNVSSNFNAYKLLQVIYLMKQIFLLLFFLVTSILTNGQIIYSKAFGESKNKAIIFIHGGPSGNSTLFECTTAQRLADNGFYVIIYDKRGEGRSIDTTAKFTYQEAFDDLNNIFKTYNIRKATILGHSFGGLVATLFAYKYPQKIEALILAGALFSQQETYDNILKSVGQIYKIANDSFKINKIRELESIDKNSAQYRKGCFNLASENNFFKMPQPTLLSDSLRKQYELIFSKENIRNQNAPFMFYKNEVLKNIDTKKYLRKLKAKVKMFSIYGKQDLIFSGSQMKYMKNLVGLPNFSLIDNCSHYLFVDQQKNFINKITKWLK
jgi:proline iminopeptidase